MTRLTVMMYIRYPLSLRPVGDILFKRSNGTSGEPTIDVRSGAKGEVRIQDDDFRFVALTGQREFPAGHP